jgi:hypothetical protein
MDSRLLEQLAGASGFGAAAIGQRHIDPSGEPVFQIPLRLTVTNESESRHQYLH